MKVVILGAGLQGTACALDLCRSDRVISVVMTDQSQPALDKAKTKIDSSKMNCQHVDVTSAESMRTVMTGADVVISAVPYFLNKTLMPLAIDAHCHWVDMGGNTDLVLRQLEYDAQAKQAGVTAIPDMGLAPGFANLLAAELIAGFDAVESVKIRVGGLPQEPKPPLDYQLFFSVEGLINEYIGMCDVLVDGKRERVKSLTEVETLEFPDPLGRCEAFYTLGGSSTLPWTYEGRVKNLDYKTVRYQGHAEKIRLLEELGFFETDPLQTRDGLMVSPRQTTAAVLNKLLATDNPRDTVVIRVTVSGTKAGEAQAETFECIEHYNDADQLTAMMRTTAFPVSIVAQLLGTGAIQQPGVFPPERVVPVGVVREEMARRGIVVRHME